MMEFLEKRLKMAAWLFFVLFFLAYMFNADRVYHALSGKAYSVKLPDDSALYAKGDVQYNWSPWGIKTVNDKFEAKLMFSGSVSKVANKSGNAKIRVFFRSPSALYEVMDNRHTFRADTNEIIVNFFASTSQLDKGIYNIGLYLIDDDGARFVWMNSFFEKAADGPVEYIARPVDLAPTGVSTDLNFAIESIGKDGKDIVFQGWAVLGNAEMNDYSAYIAIRDSKNVTKTFYAPFFTRMDIASLYEDIRAANSGFQIRIPQDAVATGKHVVKVIIKSRKTGEVLESVQTETRNF